MNIKNILLFSYSSKEHQYPFFKDLMFTNKPTHKVLEFLCPLDKVDKRMSKIHAEILFIEESANIPDNLYRTISSADNILLIYTNSSLQVKEKLMIITRGKIHRKIIEVGPEQQIALHLISKMAKAYAVRKRKVYYDRYEELLSIFYNNYLQEAQLQIMHACNNKKRLHEILSIQSSTDISELMIETLIGNKKIKDLLSRLANEELSEEKAVLNVKTQLHKELFFNTVQTA